LKIEVEIDKAFKIRTRGNRYIVMAELTSWKQKRDIMSKKRGLKERIFIDARRPNEKRKGNTGSLKR